MNTDETSQESVRSVGGKDIALSATYLRQKESNPSLAGTLCKICGEPGLRLLQVTVLTHIEPKYWGLVSDGFRFSSNPSCPVIYFNNNSGVYFLHDEVRTRFGLKEKEDPRPVCYCLGILEENIRYEILKKGCCDSLEDIVEYTKAGTGKWCLTTNPSGKCCRDYLPTIVEKYLSMKGIRRARPKLENVKDKLTKADEKPSKRIGLRVDGMTCESCSTHVYSVIEKLGGKDIKVSLKENSAEFSASADVRPDEIAKTIEETGYKAQVAKVERIE